MTQVPPLTNPSDVERYLVEMWTEILGVPVNPNDDFFTLGGRSMVAVRMLVTVMSAYGADIDLDQFFAEPTVRTLARLLGRAG